MERGNRTSRSEDGNSLKYLINSVLSGRPKYVTSNQGAMLPPFYFPPSFLHHIPKATLLFLFKKEDLDYPSRMTGDETLSKT